MWKTILFLLALAAFVVSESEALDTLDTLDTGDTLEKAKLPTVNRDFWPYASCNMSADGDGGGIGNGLCSGACGGGLAYCEHPQSITEQWFGSPSTYICKCMTTKANNITANCTLDFMKCSIVCQQVFIGSAAASCPQGGQNYCTCFPFA